MAARPPIRLRYLLSLAALLVALLAALAVNELRAARQVIAEAMEVGSASLVAAIGRAGENAIRADARIEAATADRLLGLAHLLRELDRQGRLADSTLARLAAETGLYRINVYDRAGRRVLTSAPEAHGPDGGAAPELDDLLAGRVEELVIGFRQGRFHGGERYAAAVRRDGGGAVVVNIEAQEMLAFRREGGIGRLMQEIAATRNIVYLVLQDRRGLVLASRGVARLGRIEGEAFLEEALAGEGPRSRLTEHDGAEVFETVLPFWVDAESRGLIRVALAADAMAVAEARSRRRLAVWAGLLAVVGIAASGWIAVRQSYAVLGEAHARIQTYSSRLLEHMADAVVAVDAAGRIEVYNRAAEGLFGVPAAAARGAPVAAALGEGGQ
ncbi:MAG: PAS domain-containing protein, partial [Gemmatimonadota bacterium]